MTSPRVAEAAKRKCFGREATIVGTSGHDELWGTAGTDVIVGLGGRDYIADGPGRDFVCGGAGFDFFQYTYGPDKIDGGPGGADFADYSYSWGITVRGKKQRVKSTDMGPDDLYGVEIIGGSSYRDLMYGTSGQDLYLGGDGNDLLRTLGGPDNLIGEGGNDHLDGGGGSRDLVTYYMSSFVIASLADAEADTSEEGHDSLEGIEGLEANTDEASLTGDENANGLFAQRRSEMSGGAGDDLLWGGSGSDSMLGGDGNDYLFGDRGGDSLSGEPGEDVLEGGRGDDELIGGDATDAVSYWRAAAPITANLTDGGATGEGTDSFTEIEWIEGSSLDDHLTGDIGPNSIWGLQGDDVLKGELGDDFLHGGEGNDDIDGGLGLDKCEGGEVTAGCEPLDTPLIERRAWPTLDLSRWAEFRLPLEKLRRSASFFQLF